MSFFRKLFPKKKESRDEAVTEMRATINKMTLRVRGFERKAGDSKQRAKEFVRQGNATGARTHLRKWKRYTTWMNRYHRQVGSLEDVIDMIETARDTAEMGRAMELGLEQLEQARQLMSSEKATEVMLKTEQLVDEIERTSEMLSAQALDEGEDIDVERELTKLQEEVAIEEVKIRVLRDRVRCTESRTQLPLDVCIHQTTAKVGPGTVRRVIGVIINPTVALNFDGCLVAIRTVPLVRINSRIVGMVKVLEGLVIRIEEIES